MEGIVQAKFKCVEKTQIPEGHRVLLTPVVSGSKENEEYFKYTPYGKIEMGTINDAAAERFVVGKEYYISFSPAS